MSNLQSTWQGAGRRIHMQEVGTRDGLQAESAFVPTEDKIALVNALSDAGLAKIVVVVDDDINIRDPWQVDWAIAFRMQPATDIRIIPDTDPITLDPSQPLKDGKVLPAAEQVSSKLGIDATKKHPYPAPSVPPKEHLEKVAAQWERYGIRPVSR